MFVVETASHTQVEFAHDGMQRLREAIHHLPSEEREVFLLRQNGELTYAQIAHLDNRSVEAVKGLMRSALRKLRTAIQEI
jgi:RNA polymerase sigma-70 factor (ECF subfamily)